MKFLVGKLRKNELVSKILKKRKKMIYKGFNNYELEEGEPMLRSCPECNPAHKNLMDTDYFHTCFECGRNWIFGRYLDSFESDKEMDDFLKEKLTKFKEHKPYITCIEIRKKEVG